jgi:RNA-directed DNA polymerase
MQTDEETMQMKSKMRQMELFVDERSLIEKLCKTEFLNDGFEAVRRNRGTPGIDGVTIAAFGSRLDEELKQLKEEL